MFGIDPWKYWKNNLKCSIQFYGFQQESQDWNGKTYKSMFSYTQPTLEVDRFTFCFPVNSGNVHAWICSVHPMVTVVRACIVAQTSGVPNHAF